MTSLRMFSSSRRVVGCERLRWRRASALVEFILFLGDGESEDEEVRERVNAGRRVGEGVASLVADEADAVLCGLGRRWRC